MNILFITSEGYDTPNSINHLCMTLVEDVLKNGISVHSISSHKTGTYDDMPPQLLQYAHYTYDIIPRKNIDKNRFVHRYLDELHYVFAAKKLWKKKKCGFDMVLLQSNPNSVYHAILLKVFLRKPIVLNLYDIFPGHAESIGVIKVHFIYSVLALLQKLLYALCDKIIVMSQDMGEILLRQKVKPNKLVVINNWFDDSVFTEISRSDNRFFKKYDLPLDKYYIQFAGLLGYVFDYKMFFDIAETVKEYENIEFLLIGDGNQKDVILGELEKRKPSNVQYFPWQTLDLIADVYNACDIGLIPLRDGVIGNGIPSKACQLMAAGRIVLNVVEKSKYTDLFERQNIGVNIIDKNPKTAGQKILELMNNKNFSAQLGENAAKYAFNNYSRQTNTARFVEVIRTYDIYQVFSNE